MTSEPAAAQQTVEELLAAVQQLNEAELAEFETGFEQIWTKRNAVTDPEAAKIVENHRLPLHQQIQLRELLFKNREGELTAAEALELDFYMAKMDQALTATANELLKLAEFRKQNQIELTHGPARPPGRGQ
ncbi:MAG: hypothetical protein DYG89_42475 [Caldilinea sp. CFX5]|nr:hypothetical protein [Caldilinea sp. CFX5]